MVMGTDRTNDRWRRARAMTLLEVVLATTLLALVGSPIVGSVRVHVDALRTLRELGHDPALIHLQHLQDVDHLHLQAELGEWGWRGGRYG